jgi:ribosome-binding factor A
VTVRRRTATYPRALRINQVLRQVVAEELERLADADEVPMVTVTSVEVAADMRTAVVYLASLDAATEEVLEERRGQLQRVVGSQMTMKRTPRLRFQADPAIAAGTRVEELLRGLHASGRPGAGTGTGTGSGSAEAEEAGSAAGERERRAEEP